jgi:hypothetical protein
MHSKCLNVARLVVSLGRELCDSGRQWLGRRSPAWTICGGNSGVDGTDIRMHILWQSMCSRCAEAPLRHGCPTLWLLKCPQRAKHIEKKGLVDDRHGHAAQLWLMRGRARVGGCVRTCCCAGCVQEQGIMDALAWTLCCGRHVCTGVYHYGPSSLTSLGASPTSSLDVEQPQHGRTGNGKQSTAPVPAAACLPAEEHTNQTTTLPAVTTIVTRHSYL